MSHFREFLQKEYPSANNNDANTVTLLVRAGQEFATIEKLLLLKKLRKDLELNYDITDIVEIDYEIEKLEDSMRYTRHSPKGNKANHMNLWKIIFDSAPAKYQWGAIESDGEILLFQHKPDMAEGSNSYTGEATVSWHSPLAPSLHGGWISEINNEVAKSSLVHRKG